MDARTIQNTLNANGFPCGNVDGDIGPATKAAVIRFQQAHAFVSLLIDGDPGPDTQAALSRLPNLSPHFQVSEVRCHGSGCCGGNAYVRRELLTGLETLRAKVGPLTLVDVYRCPAHNAALKGSALDSMHLYGAGADIGNMPDLQTTLDAHVFAGVGNRGSRASHVDVRDHMGVLNHTPGATPTRPARWSY